MSEGRERQVFALFERYLGDPVKLYGSRLSTTGRRVLHIAPIKPAGMLPFAVALKMVHIQSELAQLGVLVRGAISLGGAVARGNLVFGRGITTAERLRDEFAHFPRVIVNPMLLRQVEQNADLRDHTAMEELGYIRDLLRHDADGLWFVDYLWALKSEVDEPLFYLDFLKDHRQLVTRALEASTTLNRASHSSTWLWRYHNVVIDRLKTSLHIEEQELAELYIPATVSPLVYSFPPSAKAP
jgi:hypothetical protein